MRSLTVIAIINLKKHTISSQLVGKQQELTLENEETTRQKVEKAGVEKVGIAGYDFSDLSDKDDINIAKMVSEKPQNISKAPPPPPLPIIPTAPKEIPQSTAKDDNQGLTKVFWNDVKINAKTGLPAKLPAYTFNQLAGLKCIWTELPDVEIDVDKVKLNFTSTKRVVKKQKSKDKVSNKPVLTPKTSRKIALCIRSDKLDTKMSSEKLGTICTTFDMKEVTVEFVEQLDILILRDEHLDKLRESRDVLVHNEDYALQINEIPHIAEHKKIWAHLLSFDAKERKIACYLFNLKTACIELQTSTTFRVLLSHILRLGNVLRQGQTAEAFDIKFLGGIKNIKSSSKDGSALSFLEFLVATMVTDEGEFSSLDLFKEFEHAKKISDKHSLTFEEVIHLQEDLGESCQEANDAFETIFQSINDHAKTQQKDALESCRRRYTELNNLVERVGNRYGQILLYLGIMPCQATSKKWISPKVLFGYIWIFVSDFKGCQKDSTIMNSTKFTPTRSINLKETLKKRRECIR